MHPTSRYNLFLFNEGPTLFFFLIISGTVEDFEKKNNQRFCVKKPIKVMYCFLFEKSFTLFYYTICDFSKKNSTQKPDMLRKKQKADLNSTENYSGNDISHSMNT